MKRKYAALFFTACLTAGLIPPVSAASFSDTTTVPWAKKSIDTMASTGAVTGYPDGTFRPNRRITRAEFVTMVNKTFSLYDSQTDSPFADVPSSSWYSKQVTVGKTAGYVSGYPNNTFRPNQLVTRAEAAAMLGKLLGLTSTTETPSRPFKDIFNVPDWARDKVNGLAAREIMTGYTDGTFGAQKLITRAEAAVMLEKAKDFKTAPPGSTDYEAAPTKGIYGDVTRNNRAVSSVNIQVFKDKSYEPEKEITTNSNGRYTLGLTSGTYNILARDGNYIAFAAGVKGGNKTATRADLRLVEGVELSGRLLDKDASPMRNTQIAFQSGTITFTGQTDSSGYYEVLVLPNRSYTLNAQDPEKTTGALVALRSTVAVGSSDKSLSDMGVGLPTLKVDARDSVLLGYKEVQVTLTGAANPEDYRVIVEGSSLPYSKTKKKFVGVIQTNKTAETLSASLEPR